VRFGIRGLTRALDAGLVRTVGRLLRAGQFHRLANLGAASEPLARFALARMREIVGDQLPSRTSSSARLRGAIRRSPIRAASAASARRSGTFCWCPRSSRRPI
jgi:hypothetical protein